MPLTLEQEAELNPLAEKAVDLVVNLIMEDNPETDREFHETVEKISVLSLLISKLYLNLYERIPNMRGKVLDYVKNNI